MLSTAVEGGNPPDIAALPQPGFMTDFAQRGALKPIDFAEDAIKEGFSQSWLDLGTVDGKLYGLFFKGANKSTIWYNVPVFKDAGVEPAETWDDFLTDGETIAASGVPAYSIGGADGWTLTDLFENIYLRQAGPEKYDQLTKHEIPWTDPSVNDALTQMGRCSARRRIAGGTRARCRPTSRPRSRRSSRTRPRRRMVLEGDFVPASSPRRPRRSRGTDYNVFAFPSINGSRPVVMGGGDIGGHVQGQRRPRGHSSSIWQRPRRPRSGPRGGFSSPNKNVDPSIYPDAIREDGGGARERRDVPLRHVRPAAGGVRRRPGQGEWKLQDFLKNPNERQRHRGRSSRRRPPRRTSS